MPKPIVHSLPLSSITHQAVLYTIAQDHPRMVWLSSVMPIYKTRIKMGEFGGETEKPTWLYSNFSFVSDISQFTIRTWHRSLATQTLTDTYVDSNGVKRCSGNAALKASQAC